MSAIHNNTQQCEWIALLTVCDSLVPLKVDSGAQVNILSLSDYEGLASKPKLLTERRPKLKTYNEENIETLGICIATVNHMGKKHRLQFVVVSKGRQSLIGASDSERLCLVTRECGVRKVCTVKENGYLQGTRLFGRDMQDTSATKLCTLCVSGEECPAVSEAEVEERA